MMLERKSYNEVGKIYFFTATIHQWKFLLQADDNKKIVINYLRELSEKGLLKIYAIVLMPNHLHIIWQQLKKNGKETAQGSFLKYTPLLAQVFGEAGHLMPVKSALIASGLKTHAQQPGPMFINIHESSRLQKMF